VFSQLDDVFGSLEFEDSGNARIAAVAEESAALRIRLHVRFDAADVPEQMWEFVCGELRTYELRSTPISSVEFVAEHSLLIPYTTSSVSLNFVGRPASPSALVGELWEAHQEVTQGWIAFDAFLNAGLKTTDLLASGNGILATGPRPFLDRYAAVLTRHGLRVAWVGEGEPRQWRDGAWGPEKGDLRALVLDDSYIIGREWTDARRLA
jgi:hypothetical protein